MVRSCWLEMSVNMDEIDWSNPINIEFSDEEKTTLLKASEVSGMSLRDLLGYFTADLREEVIWLTNRFGLSIDLGQVGDAMDESSLANSSEGEREDVTDLEMSDPEIIGNQEPRLQPVETCGQANPFVERDVNSSRLMDTSQNSGSFAQEPPKLVDGADVACDVDEVFAPAPPNWIVDGISADTSDLEEPVEVSLASGSNGLVNEMTLMSKEEAASSTAQYTSSVAIQKPISVHSGEESDDGYEPVMLKAGKEWYFEMDTIIAGVSGPEKGSPHYLIKYVGYPLEQSSWQPRKEVRRFGEEKIRQFHANHGKFSSRVREIFTTEGREFDAWSKT